MEVWYLRKDVGKGAIACIAACWIHFKCAQIKTGKEAKDVAVRFQSEM